MAKRAKAEGSDVGTVMSELRDQVTQRVRHLKGPFTFFVHA